MTATAAPHPRPRAGCRADRLPARRLRRPGRAARPTWPTTRTPTAVEQDVLVYDAARLRPEIADAGRAARGGRPSWSAPCTDGPGVVVFRGAFADLEVVDRATAAFDAIIADRARGRRRGGRPLRQAPGANDRIWNALEKLAVRDPETFVDYYANDIIALICHGLARPRLPGHLAGQRRPTRAAQAQDPHRDYHLGFLANEAAARTRPTCTCCRRC